MDKGIWGSMAFCEDARKHIKDVNVLPKWCPKAKLRAIEEMSTWLPSRACIERAIDKMFESSPDFHRFIGMLKRREVRRKMAIDYKEEWEKFRVYYGRFCIADRTTKDGLPLHVGRLMEDWIKDVINSREKLMEQYIKENIITTDISGGNKDYHEVRLVDKRYNTTICTRSIAKSDFRNWLKNRMKGGK